MSNGFINLTQYIVLLHRIPCHLFLITKPPCQKKDVPIEIKIYGLILKQSQNKQVLNFLKLGVTVPKAS